MNLNDLIIELAKFAAVGHGDFKVALESWDGCWIEAEKVELQTVGGEPHIWIGSDDES